jgi:hypothetical protein
MSDHIADVDRIPMIPLDAYIGAPETAPFIVSEVLRPESRQFAAAMQVFEQSFVPGATIIDREAFGSSLVRAERSSAGAWSYHLWALCRHEGAVAEGMASFFTLSPYGFGGYVALHGSLARTGRLRPLLARIERQMIEDRNDCTGWLIECEPATPTAPFERFGFREIALPFSQPDLSRPDAAGPPVVLRYKQFGRTYGSPILPREAFLAGLRSILAVVYGVNDPAGHPSYERIRQALADRPRIPFARHRSA